MPERLVLLPGMGADARMHAGVAVLVPGLIAADWSPAVGGRSLDEVAALLIAHHRIGPDDAIGGSSLGGIVAGRIAERVGCRELVLIGSALHPREIAAPLRGLLGVGAVAPLGLARLAAASSARHLLSAMYVGIPTAFVRAMLGALRRWPGYRGSVPVRRIHGARDRVITPPVSGAALIPGAGHLVAMSHPAICASHLT